MTGNFFSTIFYINYIFRKCLTVTLNQVLIALIAISQSEIHIYTLDGFKIQTSLIDYVINKQSYFLR